MAAERFWQVQGNSQEQQSFSYPGLYQTNTAAGPVDISNLAVGGAGFEIWQGQSAAIIAALRPTGTNIITVRPHSISTVRFAALYNSNHDAFEADAKAFCAAYMAQNCFLCAITVMPSLDPAHEPIRVELNRRLRLWGPAYYHALADFAADPTYGPYPGVTSDGTHWTAAVHTQMETILRPQLDSFNRTKKWNGRRF